MAGKHVETFALKLGKNARKSEKWKHFVSPQKRLKCVWLVLGSVCELNLGRLGRLKGS